MSARKRRNEEAAVESLMQIYVAQSRFREGDLEHDGRPDYGTLSELAQAGLIDAVLGSGTKDGYLFEARYSSMTSEFLWLGIANPRILGVTGDRSFETNHCGVIFYTTAGPMKMAGPDCEAR